METQGHRRPWVHHVSPLLSRTNVDPGAQATKKNLASLSLAPRLTADVAETRYELMGSKISDNDGDFDQVEPLKGFAPLCIGADWRYTAGCEGAEHALSQM